MGFFSRGKKKKTYSDSRGYLRDSKTSGLMHRKPYCNKCKKTITPGIYDYSMRNCGKALCMNCQESPTGTLRKVVKSLKEEPKPKKLLYSKVKNNRGYQVTENTNHVQTYSKLKRCKPKREPITKKEPTKEAQVLSNALNDRGVETVLEQWDGFKHIDIAIKSVKLNVEVDGKHHQAPKQALADLKRVCFSSVKGYETIRIPNSLVKKDLEEIADWIKELVQKRQSKINGKRR